MDGQVTGQRNTAYATPPTMTAGLPADRGPYLPTLQLPTPAVRSSSVTLHEFYHTLPTHYAYHRPYGYPGR